MPVDLASLHRYLCGVRILRPIVCCFFFIAAFTVQASDATPVRPAEYMLYQYPDIDLVVKIDAAEVEFESEIYGPEQALLKSSGVPGRRIGPVYQFIDAVDTPRQLMVKVTPSQKIDRSRISMELIQLSARDRNSQAYARAYKLFAAGMEIGHNEDSATWSSKAYTLMNAASAFAALGWEEMQLWAEYYAAHLVLHRLDDDVTAIEMAQETQQAAQRAGLEEVRMAALLLESEALLSKSPDRRGKWGFERIHDVQGRLAALSGALGFRSEQARALFNDGRSWEQQDRLEDAVGQYEKALEIALSAGDTVLADDIRGVAALAYEAQGRTAGAIEMLTDVGTDEQGRAVGEEPDDQGQLLFEKGRILNDNYRYAEARVELARALALEQSLEGSDWGPIGLALAEAHYALGEWESAIRLIDDSVPRTSAESQRPELAEAYGRLASMYRQELRFAEMERSRDRQENLLRSDGERAQFYLERGRDLLAREGAASATAGRQFDRSRQIAAQAGALVMEQRATLYGCLNRISQGGSRACDPELVDRAHQDLQRSAIPRLAVEAAFIRAQILRLQGKIKPAADGMQSLLGEIDFLRHSLPGVLGAWYWQNRTAIFREFMQATLADVGTQHEADGAPALLALERIRQRVSLDRIEAPGGSLPAAQDETLRAQLARRDNGRGENATDLAEQLNRRIGELRSRYQPSIEPVDRGRLRELLDSLARSESVLGFYLDGRTSIALLARRSGVRLLRLDGADELPSLIRDARLAAGQGSDSAIPLLDRLGQLLLAPLAAHLGQQIYLLPAGLLDGFPFDLLRVDRHYLAQRAQTVNLMSLAALEHRRLSLEPDFAANVFLAGNPQNGQDPFNYEVPFSAEINTVRDRFVGLGLHIVQGVALMPDEFRGESLTGAGLIHLAMPGILDLAHPDRSRLKMSSGAGAPEGGDLMPADIRAQRYRAGLVVLSHTAVTGTGGSPFDTGLGFVTDFLESGAHRVVATLWPLEEAESARFVNEFYEHLARSGDAAEALRSTRLARIEQKNYSNFRGWAGFQLFIR